MKKLLPLAFLACCGLASARADVVSLYYPNGCLRVYFDGVARENVQSVYVKPGSTLSVEVPKDKTAVFTLAPTSGLRIVDWKCADRQVAPSWESLGVADSPSLTWTGRSDKDTPYYLTVDLAWFVYRIEFDMNGGSGNRKTLDSICYTNRFALPLNDAYAKFSKAGHSFVGWSLKTDAEAPEFADGEEVDGGVLGVKENDALVALHAVWSPNSYSVTLDCALDGARCPSNKTCVTYGKPYGALPEPERTGYVFAGWYTAPGGGTHVAKETTVEKAEDHVLYARWTKRTYEIKTTVAPVGSGVVTGAGTYDYATDVWLEAVPAVGSRFVRWSDGATGARRSVTVSSPLNLVAFFAPVRCTATLDCALDGARCATNAVPVTYGQPYGALPEPARTGFAFEGWYTAPSGGTRVTSDTNVAKAEDHALYAHWSRRSYEIKTAAAGSGGGVVTITKTGSDSVAGSGTYDYATDVWLEAVPAAGSRFVRWSDGATAPKRKLAVSSHANFNAVFEAIRYAVRYDYGGGDPGTANPSFADFGCAFAVSDPVWAGHVFTGWSLSGDVDFATARIGDSFETLGGAASSDKAKGANGATWFRDLASVDEASVSLVANWSPSVAKVSLSHPGNKTSGLATAVTVTYGVRPADLGTTPSFGEGCSFGGYWQGENGQGKCLWDADGVATEAWSDLQNWPAPGDVVAHAWKKARTYTLVLHPDAKIGVKTTSLPCTNGVPVRLPATNACQTADRTFLGWAKDENAAVPDFEKGGLVWGSDSGLPINADNVTIDLHAVWRNERHHVTFDADGGPSSADVFVTNGTTFACLAGLTPEKEDNAFLRWETASGAIVDSNSVVALAGDVTLYAVWSNANPTVTFQNGEGYDAEYRRQPFDALNAVTLWTNGFARSGHVFRGWAFAADAAEPAYLDGATVVTNRSFTLHALWREMEPVPRRVVFRANGGVGAPAPLENVTADFSAPTNAPRRGDLWTFAGWSTNAAAAEASWTDGDTVRLADLEFGENGETRLYAVWKSKLTDLSRAVDCDNLILETGTKAPDKEADEEGSSVNPWFVGGDGDECCAMGLSTNNIIRTAQMWVTNFPAGVLEFDWKKKGGQALNFTMLEKKGDWVGENSSCLTSEWSTLSVTNSEQKWMVTWDASKGTKGAITGYVDHVAWWPNLVSVCFVADGVDGYPRTNEYVTLKGANKYGDVGGLPSIAASDFLGWYTAEDGEGGVAVTDDCPITNQFIVLYAHWRQAAPSVDMVSIAFQTNGVPYAEATCVSNRACAFADWPAPPTPEKGKVFAGWHLGAEQMTHASIYVSNVVLQAVWADAATARLDEGMMVTFWLDAAQTRAWHKSVYDAAGTYEPWPSDPVCNGFAFSGWWTSAEGGDRVESHYSVSVTNHDFFAHWTPTTNRTEVSFMANLSAGEKPWKTVAFAAAAESGATYGAAGAWPASAPVRAGYVFDGWCAGRTGGAETTAASPFDATLTKLYARWKYVPAEPVAPTPSVCNPHAQVTFFVNDGTDAVWSKASCPTGFAYCAHASWPTPSRGENWTFLGWFKTPVTNGLDVAVRAEDLVWADASLYAQWRPNHVLVTFDPQGGECAGSADAWTEVRFCGEVVSEWSQPTRAGFVFVGWGTASDAAVTGIVSQDAWRVPATDVTLYAVWRTESTPAAPDSEDPSPARLTFFLNDGTDGVWTTALCPTGFVYDVIWPADPSRGEGWTFLGWFKTATPGDSDMAVTRDTVAWADADLHARWREDFPHDDPTPPDDPPDDPTPPDDPPDDPTPPDDPPDDPTPPEDSSDDFFMGDATYNGWTCDDHGVLSGLLVVKAAKAASAKKGGQSKLTIYHTPFGGKKKSVKLSAAEMPATNQLAVVAIPGVGSVRLRTSELEGVDCNVRAVVDFAKSKDKAVKNAAKEALANLSGTWTVALAADAGFVSLTVTVDKNGKGQLSGCLPDGTSVSVSSQGVLVDGGNGLAIPFIYAKKWRFGFLFRVDAHGNASLEAQTTLASPDGVMRPFSVVPPSSAFALAEGPHAFVCEDLAVEQPFTVDGSKWSIPRHVKRPKDGDADPNPASVKLTFTKKTGIVKGSFSAVPPGEAKAVTFTVRGVVVGGRLYGTGYKKKKGSYAVFAN